MITRRRTLAAIAAAIAAPFVSREAAAATHPGPKPPPKPRPPMSESRLDVLLKQGIDNSFTIPFVNPPTYIGGPLGVPDPTKITSADFVVLSQNYGPPVTPAITLGSGITFAMDASGSACDVTVTFTEAQLSSLLGTLTQERSGCLGDINITSTVSGVTTDSYIGLRIVVYPNSNGAG